LIFGNIFRIYGFYKVEGRRRAFMIYLPNEEEILRRAKKGEREAFDELYNHYKRPVLNYIYRFVGNLSSAEELTQEVFVRAYINIKKFVPRPRFSSWLFTIAANLSKNYLRHASYEKRLMPVEKDSYAGDEEKKDLVDNIEDKAKRPDEKAQAAENERLLQDAINKLPPQLKEALILCDIEGFSYEEAAKIMCCKAMTVGSRLWRAREKLAELLHYIKNGE
jgi:RNA polymerase sigma-70 factor (ECF subfamily)